MTAVKPGVARPPAVDKLRLSADDYEQYQTFLRRWDRGPTLRDSLALFVVTAIFGVVGIGGFLATVFWFEDSPEEMNRIVTPVAFALLAGIVPYVWFVWHSRRRWRIQLNTEARRFLHERIQDAPQQEREDDDPVNPYWATGDYDPRRYHAAFRGMSRQDRDYIRSAYGDLETWESNHPD